MKPDPLPDGVSIEMTASPNLETSSLTGDGFEHPRRKKPDGSASTPWRERGPACADLVDLGSPRDLVSRNPQKVVSQVNIKGILLLGDDLAGDALPVLENHGLEFAGSELGTADQAKPVASDEAHDQRTSQEPSSSQFSGLGLPTVPLD